MAGLFQVLYGTADGTFRQAEVLKGTDGEPLIIPADRQAITEKICTRPFAVDWDADDHLDLVVGNFAGTFYWFKGEGKGKFAPKPEPILVGDAPLRIEGGRHSDPFVIDWDGDGDLDLLSGSSNGGVQWAENAAGQGKLPELGPFQTLIETGQAVEYGQPLSQDDLTGPTQSTRIWVDDVNGDHKLDLLVGDSVTLISPVEGLSDEEFKTKYEQWRKAVKTAQAAMSRVPDESSDAEDSSDSDAEVARTKAIEEFRKVYNQRSEFIHEDRTGFVWLYLQK